MEYINIYDYIKENYIEHIYLDFDEVLVNSIDSVLLQLNRRFKTNYTMNDCKTWNFTNLFPTIKSIEIEEIFDSKDFFSTLTWKDGAIEFINMLESIITIVTCGNAMNLKLKEDWIKKQFPNIDFIGLESTKMDKSSVHMGLRTIHIDDNQKNLDSTNAQHKILFENVKDTDWNNEWIDEDNFKLVNYLGSKSYIEYCRRMKGWK